MTSLYLLRHGALSADSHARFIGQTDLPLSPEGLCQGQMLGKALRDCGIEAIYCSDLLRSRQTAALIGEETGASIEARPALREIALGEWEGLTRREVAARFPAQYASRGADLEHYRVPGGESFSDVRDRVFSVWNAMLHSGHRSIAVVGHAGVNRLFLAGWLGMPVENIFRIGQDYGRVNVVECDDERIKVRLINGRPADLRRDRAQDQ